jgi:2Fe-2S ferredoxin
MPKVIFEDVNGDIVELTGDVGDSIMYVATANSVDGIEAECGGFCNCATCHIYVSEEWATKLPAISEHEDELLDGTVSERMPTSRLSCQVNLTEELDGIVVRTPDRQI